MTIDDEKVVAWFSVSGYGGSVFVSEDRACVESWIEHRNADQDRRGVSEGYRSKGPFSLIPQSAYAELAAELERANELADKYKWQVRDTCVRAEKAESQLAELRGKCEALSTDISEAVEDVARSGGYINSDEAKGWSVELRTLAAADSSLQSRDGG